MSAMNLFRRTKSCVRRDIDPDEIFLDSQNLPGFDVNQFEGRIEKPVSMGSMVALSAVFLLMLAVLLGRAWVLQAKNGDIYSTLSENNTLKETTIYAERGAIFDRNGVKLAWNMLDASNTDFAMRAYTSDPGFGHILGYIKYPSKDKSGNYYRKDYVGMAGVEQSYNDLLQGEHGMKIVETDALNRVASESVIRPAKDGENLTLSIDAAVQKELFQSIRDLVDKAGFVGGTGAIMDLRTGEMIALTSYPEYDSNVMSDGGDSKTISKYLSDPRKPFLDRFLNGLYAPGSVVKPYVALGALQEGIIDPEKLILSTGSISIPNPYDPTKSSIFMDWQPQGYMDMKKAIAVSSDVYFYEIGGGFQDQPGLGINKLNKYFDMFGFGKNDLTGFFAGPAGAIPSPAWKEQHFPGDPWRLGDTYFTAIGQYGFQATPMHLLRAVATIADGGEYLTPTILRTSSSTPPSAASVPIDPKDLDIVRQGMREGAQIGTAKSLNLPYIDVAAKTGTAEIGATRAYVNSWVTGFFPYEHPRYAFVAMMEHGPHANVFGASLMMKSVFDWMHETGSPYILNP